MSGTAVRASKREIRRAFGDEAVQTLVDHQEAILAHTEQIRILTREVMQVGGDLFKLNARLANELLPRQNTLRGRVRWLLTGR